MTDRATAPDDGRAPGVGGAPGPEPARRRGHEGTRAEEARIHAVYATRAARDRRYSWFEPSYVQSMHELEDALLAVLGPRCGGDLAGLRILDVGCGRGAWLQQFVRWGATPRLLAGVDLLPDRVAEARRVCAAEVELRCGSATALDWPDGTFDVVLQFVVLSSILDPDVRRQVAAEMLRVVRPGGIVVSYDLRLDNPRNRQVTGIGARELRRLFPGCGVTVRRVTLAPPLARRLAPLSPALCRAAAAVPWLRTHLLAVVQHAAR